MTRRRRAREFSVRKSRGTVDGADGMAGRSGDDRRAATPLAHNPGPQKPRNPREFDGDALGGRDGGARASRIERAVVVAARDDGVDRRRGEQRLARLADPS